MCICIEKVPGSNLGLEFGMLTEVVGFQNPCREMQEYCRDLVNDTSFQILSNSSFNSPHTNGHYIAAGTTSVE
jgi:hypothetical protein